MKCTNFSCFMTMIICLMVLPQSWAASLNTGTNTTSTQDVYRPPSKTSGNLKVSSDRSNQDVAAQTEERITKSTSGGAECVSVTNNCGEPIFFPWSKSKEVPENKQNVYWKSCIVIKECSACGTTAYDCSEGTSINNLDAITEYQWTCQGTSVGDESCKLSKNENGVCSTTQVQRCTSGARSNVSTGTDYKWDCNAIGTGTSQLNCSAPVPKCGTDHQQGKATAPSSADEKCERGTPSAITNAGLQVYNWTCNSMNQNVSCTNVPANPDVWAALNGTT